MMLYHNPIIERLILKRAYQIYEWRKKYEQEGDEKSDYYEAERQVMTGEWRDN
jgi:hypothetical protein